MEQMTEKMKVLDFIMDASQYCRFMKMFYSVGYTIHHSCTHPRSITIPKGVVGYIEKRDKSGDTYKIVIYGKTRRPYNNARVVYLTRQSKGE